MSATAERFEGFPPGAIEFYAGLAEDNSKAWFDAHREIYERCVREPLELLAAELNGELGPAKVFRPHRDVRFSRDKSPYKLNAAVVWMGPPGRASHTYLSLDADGLFVAAGRYAPERGALARIREAIDDPRLGPELERVVADLEAAGLTFAAPALRTAPRGWPRDHPRVALLRRTSFTAHRRFPLAPWLHERATVDRARAVWTAAEPLRAWLDRAAPA